MKEFSPDLYNEYLLRNRKPSLAFDENADYDTWRQQVKEKLTELLGDMPEEKVPLNIRVEWEKDKFHKVNSLNCFAYTSYSACCHFTF